MIASAWQPAQSGEVLRKGCKTSSACVVSMLVYIDVTSAVKKQALGSKVRALSFCFSVFFDLMVCCVSPMTNDDKIAERRQ